MLFLWTKPSPLQALELLDAKFADPTIREYGVHCLENIVDGELYEIMPLLTQVYSSLHIITLLVCGIIILIIMIGIKI